MDRYFAFKIAERLYYRAHWLYRPMYTAYKSIVEREELDLLKNLVRPGDTIADIGANIGYFTRVLSRLCGPTGVVHAFEPYPQSFSHLKRATRNMNNVVAHHAAVEDRMGECQLFLSKEMNVDHRTYPSEEQRDSITVPAVALDALFPDISFDFVKMDIQGKEYSALKGMRALLRRGKRMTLLMEIWPYGMQQAGFHWKMIYDLLNDAGFSIAELDGTTLDVSEKISTRNGYYDYFNVLATRN